MSPHIYKTFLPTHASMKIYTQIILVIAMVPVQLLFTTVLQLQQQ